MILREMVINLKVLLAERDMTQKDLAEKIGFSGRAISDLTSRKTKRYNKELLEAIINEFNLDSMDELFKIVEK